MNEIVGVRIVSNDEVARATRWLVLEADEDLPWQYAPGNILAIWAPDATGRQVRHPYTVSWAEGARLGVLYRVIAGGTTTPTLAGMGPGDTLRLAGRYGEPIARLVGDAPRVIGVSTGTGVGPLLGHARVATHTVRILSGFREEADIPRRWEHAAGADWMQTLSRAGSDWAGAKGRVDAALADVAEPGAHWHLVGNGQMVADVRAGLLAAGLPADRVTAEVYFNKATPPDPVVVQRIGRALEGRL